MDFVYDLNVKWSKEIAREILVTRTKEEIERESSKIWSSRKEESRKEKEKNKHKTKKEEEIKKKEDRIYGGVDVSCS